MYLFLIVLQLSHSGHPTEHTVVYKEFPQVLAPSYDAKEMVLRLLTRFTEGKTRARDG